MVAVPARVAFAVTTVIAVVTAAVAVANDVVVAQTPDLLDQRHRPSLSKLHIDARHSSSRLLDFRLLKCEFPERLQQ